MLIRLLYSALRLQQAVWDISLHVDANFKQKILISVGLGIYWGGRINSTTTTIETGIQLVGMECTVFQQVMDAV